MLEETIKALKKPYINLEIKYFLVQFK